MDKPHEFQTPTVTEIPRTLEPTTADTFCQKAVLMETPGEFQGLQNAMDRYLDIHGHSDEAYVRVTDIMHKWEFMIGLATQRAMSQLFYENLPDNVIPLQRPVTSPDFAS